MELSNVWHSEDSTEPERKPMLEVGILKNGVSVRVSVSVLVSSKLFGFCFGFDQNQKRGFGRRLPPPALVASSPPSSRPRAVAPRPLWRLPPPALVASSPPSSRPQAVAPRPLWRLPPPALALVASSPSSPRHWTV